MVRNKLRKPSKVLKAKPRKLKQKHVVLRAKPRLCVRTENATTTRNVVHGHDASRWKKFSPKKIDVSCCYARTWAYGQGGQCTRPLCKPGKPFCRTHAGGQWKVHGRVDGPIPLPKLIEFEMHACKGSGERQSKRAALVPVSGGPRKLMKSKQEQTVKEISESSVATCENIKKVEPYSCTRLRKTRETRVGDASPDHILDTSKRGMLVSKVVSREDKLTQLCRVAEDPREVGVESSMFARRERLRIEKSSDSRAVIAPEAVITLEDVLASRPRNMSERSPKDVADRPCFHKDVESRADIDENRVQKKPMVMRRLALPIQAFTRSTECISHVFDFPSVEFVRHLEMQGYAVLRGILGDRGCSEFGSMFWQSMSHIVPGLKQHDPQSWNFPKGSHGICSSYGLPQADFAWMVRTSRRIYDAFEIVFADKCLVVSTDAIIVSRKRAGCRPKPWFHRDQRPELKMLSYQGIYSLYGCGEDNGGTVLVPQSHSRIDDWEPKGCGINFVPAPEHVQEQLAHVAVKPFVPPDSLLVFNSRLLHAGEPARVDRTEPGTGVPLVERIAVPVTFCPAARRSEKTRNRKIDMYHRGLASTHWPDDNFSVKKPSRWEFVKGGRPLPLPVSGLKERLDLL